MTYFFKITFRNFLRHRFSTGINLVGLTTGLACALFIFLWVRDELAVNKFHKKDDRLFRVMEFQTYSNERFATNSTPGILGENIKLDIPEVEYSATTTWVGKSLLAYEDKFLKEDGFHVGEDYFNIFSYPLLEGNPDEVLKEKTSIVISRDLAVKFFEDVPSAIGKTLRYEDDRNFTVSGVFENIPAKSTYRFDFVLPFEDYKDRNDWVKSWGNNGPHTYVILEEGANWKAVSAKINPYIQEKNTEEESNVELFLKKYSEQYLYGKYTNGIPDGGRIEYVRLFSIIAIIILVIACINFMNLSTARASKRAHEVGVRKAIGGDRRTLIRQYIGESLIISTISMILALGIVSTFLSPFNEITDKSIQLHWDLSLIGPSVLAILVTGLLAGSYPAFYLTHFNPAAVLKGEIKNSPGEVWARKGLVTFQFWITVMLIVGVIVIQKQMQYANSKNLGYNRDNVVFFNQDGSIGEKTETFLSELRNIPGVVSASSTSHTLLSQMSNTQGLEWRDKDPSTRILFENFRVDEEFQQTMGFEMVAGRWFSQDFGSDTTKIIFNEKGVKAMGFTPEEAVGETIKLWEEYDLQIVGVVKDFHFQSIHTEVDPAFFWLRDTWQVAARLQAGSELATMKQVQELYEKFAPGFIFDYRFLDDSYQKLYSSEQRIGTLSSYFAGLAILISCLGLFGLAAFTAERRLKEIGIRKVLGANASQIVMMLSMDFTKQIIVAILFAIPVAYYLMNIWLESFAYAIELSPWIFISAAILSLVIAWLTVGSQALRAAHINPSQCLKDE
ncbi:MAG: ABC transporter permease [Cytophagales bacterium]|nr:ABC transporter permease [Cytophagales bacterium]